MVAAAKLSGLAVFAGVHMPQHLVAQPLDVQAKANPQGVNALKDDPHRDQRGRQDPEHEEAAGQ